MFFFDHILTPPKGAGRHSTVGLIERLTRELAKVREAHAKEIQGYKDALQEAAESNDTLTRERDEARGRSDYHRNGWIAATAEIERLERLLRQDAELPTAQAPAPADLPGSCFTEPAPPLPEREQEQLSPIALTLPRPVECEAADVTAETQAVPQIGCDETQAMSVAEVRNATGEGDTRTDLPIVRPVTPVAPVLDDTQLIVTWGRTRDEQTAAIEANLAGVSPTPEYAATAVPPGLGDLAHANVEAVLSEAS